MATQKTWSYQDALDNFGRTTNNLSKFGLTPEQATQMGIAAPTGTRSWEDVLRGNAYQTLGQSAMAMTPAQLESYARQNGILGGKEQSFGEIAMEGLTGPLLLPAAFTGAGLATGAFGGAGASSGALGAGEAALAGGGEVGSGYAAAAPGGGLGNTMWDADMLDWSLGPNSMSPAPWQGGANLAASGVNGLANSGSLATPAPQGPAPAPVPNTPPTVPAATSIFDKVLSSPSILGAAGGALLGGLGGGSSPAGNVTTTEEMPDWLKGYMKPALDKYGTQLQNYQVDPYGVMSSAGKQYADTINGMYLTPDSNKYLQDYFNAGAERVKGTLSPSFGHMQAFGSHSGYNEALAGGLSDLATGIYGGAYDNERNRQAALTASAPAFLTQQSQAAFAPYQSYLQTLSGLGKQKTQPYFDNPFGNILGGAMAGYGLGNIFK